jgi:aminoglycoside/choline kinase family phosphotransferase
LDMSTEVEQFYRTVFGVKPKAITPLAPGASRRSIYRVFTDKGSVVAVVNDNISENLAFIGFSRTFHSLGLCVPEILAVDTANRIYLQQDLGDKTLLDELRANRVGSVGVSESVLALYRKVVTALPLFQIKAGPSIDYKLCFISPEFDRAGMIKDMFSFRDNFLSFYKNSWDEQALDRDFGALAELLCTADRSYFMYRDLQARNVMVKGGQVYFIDYDRGRRGALQYDIASLLFQSSAELPRSAQEQLLKLYLDTASSMIPLDRIEFERLYPGFVLIRMMQVLGVYGKLGIVERKEHFLKSIPGAIRNLQFPLDRLAELAKWPELRSVLELLVMKEKSGHEF